MLKLDFKLPIGQPFSKRIFLQSLTTANLRLLHDMRRFIVITAARRSRKTIICMNKLEKRSFKRAINEGIRDADYFHAAPTRDQAKSIFWNKLQNNTADMWVKNPDNTKLIVHLPLGIRIHVIGLDRPERAEGTPWFGGHITEIGNTKPEMWDNHIRPVFADTNGFCFFDGVPEGKGNHLYKMALYAAGGVIPKTKKGYGAYAENPNDPEWSFHSWWSSDVLPAHEIASAKRSMDPLSFRQEMKGEFLSFQGLAYYAFSEDNINDDLEYVPGKPIHIGMDFNVSPMTATIGHIDGEIYNQFDEIYQKNSNTDRVARTLLEKYPDSEINIYPDATGKARSTKSSVTDLSILRNYGFNVYANSGNPAVRDRINNTNSRIRTADDEIRYYVSKKNCPHTVNDLNLVEILPDGRENKKQEKEQGLVHISSALGYLFSYLFPINSGGIYV